MRAPHLLIAILAIHAVAFTIAAAGSSQPASDFDRYHEIGSTAGRPYLDYPVEHPIGTLLVFKALAGLPGGRASFGLGVVVLNLCADAIIVGSLVWGWGMVAAIYGAAALVPVIGLFFTRIDSWSTAAAILAVAAWRHNRPITLGGALAVGTAFKLWPLVLATLLIVPWRGRQSLLAAAAFVLAGAVFGGAALWVAGARGVVQVLTFRGATGWQIESLVGGLVHLGDSHTLRMESGAWRIGAINGSASVAMFLAAAPICVWSSWRGARLNRIGAGWLASVTALLLLSALLSAQYVIWLAPAAAIAWTDGERRLAVLTAIAIVLTQLLWSWYGSVLAGELPALLLVVLRNTVLLAVAIDAIVTVGRNRGDRRDRRAVVFRDK